MQNKHSMHSFKYLDVILKPTTLCNMKCKHCAITFEPIVQSSPEFYIKAFQTILDFRKKIYGVYPEKIRIIWHGGEPMVLGKKFYFTIFQVLEKNFPNIQFCHGIQTNLTLLTKDWKDVIIKIFQKRVSTSYDFFSSFRPYSFLFFLDKIKLYQDMTGRRGHVICVLSNENYKKVLDICSIAQIYNFDIKLNYLYPVGKGKNLAYFELNNYFNALEKVALHRFNFSGIRIYPIDFFLDYNKGKVHDFPCPIKAMCINILAVMPDGTIWKCAELADMKEPLGFLGTIEKGISIEKFQKFLMFASDVSDKCLDCNICFGGCVKQRILYNSLQKTPFCRLWKKLMEITSSNYNNNFL